MYPCYELLLTNIIEVYAKNRVRPHFHNNTGGVYSDCLRANACANCRADGYANAISHTYARPQPNACANGDSHARARYFWERNRRPIASADYGDGARRDDRG